jgi:fermentation-respiration switch protein FrsA (DUF1100 family)
MHTSRAGLILLTVSLFGCAGCARMGLYLTPGQWERASIFQPDKYPAGEWQQTKVLVQDAFFAAADGTKLHGWYARHPQPKGHALLLHGNAGNVTLMADTIRTLNQRHGLAVLALDYRGFGKSEGTPSEEGVLLDARAGRRWLAEKEGIAEKDVILMGQSLGGAVAVDLAAKDGCRGLVLASTFTSMPAVAQHHTPWLPMRWLISTQFNSLEKIQHYHGPLLLAHGEADEVVPYHHGLKLYEAAPGPKRMITSPGGKHNDPLPESYREALDEFIANLPPLSS